MRDQLIAFAQDRHSRLGPPPEGRGVKWEREDCTMYFGRRDGSLVAELEYYVPESYSDDDASYIGLAPHRPGSARRMISASGDTLDALIADIGEGI